MIPLSSSPVPFCIPPATVPPQSSGEKEKPPVSTIGVAIIGSGGIALANHLPGFALCPDTKVVALCDSDPAVLERASRSTGITVTSTDYREILKRDDVHAVVIATPNYLHAPITLA